MGLLSRIGGALRAAGKDEDDLDLEELKDALSDSVSESDGKYTLMERLSAGLTAAGGGSAKSRYRTFDKRKEREKTAKQRITAGTLLDETIAKYREIADPSKVGDIDFAGKTIKKKLEAGMIAPKEAKTQLEGAITTLQDMRKDPKSGKYLKKGTPRENKKSFWTGKSEWTDNEWKAFQEINDITDLEKLRANAEAWKAQDVDVDKIIKHFFDDEKKVETL